MMVVVVSSSQSTIGEHVDPRHKDLTASEEIFMDANQTLPPEEIEESKSAPPSNTSNFLQKCRSFFSRCWSASNQHDHSVYIKALIVAFHFIEVTGKFVLPLVNCAVTIFGLGVGVGLVLGNPNSRPLADTLMQHSTTTNRSPTTAETTSASSTQYRTSSNDDSMVAVSSSSPSCRSTLRRVQTNIEEPPQLSMAASEMPAQ